MTKVSRHIIRYALLLMPLLLSGCGVIYDNEGNCSVKYRLKFIDDLNMDRNDEFYTEMNSLSLYAFNENQILVWSKIESGIDIRPESNDYTMDITSLAPGKYTIVVWGGLLDNSSFVIPEMVVGQSRLSDMVCTIVRGRADETNVIDYNLEPLFHGMADIEIPQENDPGVYDIATIQLTKDTNNITIELLKMDGSSLNVNDYEFYIDANNGCINYDNSLIYTYGALRYTAWSQQLRTGRAGTRIDDIDYYEDNDDFPAVMANLSLSRLVASDWSECDQPTLTINNRRTGETVLTIPVIDYSLMVRSREAGTDSDQEYLDRQSNYTMVFYLDDSDSWVSGFVIINSWRIVLLEKDLD